MFGFAITALFLSYQMITDSQSTIQRDSAFMLVFAVLCPPSLLALAIDPPAETTAFYLLWTVIALLNAGLYASVRTFVSRRLQRPE